MYGFKPSTQRGTESSGMVRGPGTGTSDSVKDAVPPGTYIMPADSTAQIGPEQLAGVGFKPGTRPGAKSAAPAVRLGFKGKGQAAEVPVNLSNGEYKLPPEQVHAVGAQVLDAMKDATHAPAQARGFRPGLGEAAPQKATDELFFADGGLVTDMNKPRGPAGLSPAGSTNAPAKPSGLSFGPGSQTAQRPATGNAPSPTNTFPGNRAEATRGMYGAANADLAKGFRGALQGLDDTATYLNRGDPVKDAAQAVGGFFARSAEQARQPNTWDDSGTRLQYPEAKPQPAPAAATTTAAVKPAQAAPAAAAMPPTASATPAQPGTPAAMATANQGPATATPAAPANNITRIGNSFSGENIAQGFTINGKAPKAEIGIVPAGASPFGSAVGSSGGDVSAALQAAAARGDWSAIQNHYQQGGGTWLGKTAAESGFGFPRSSGGIAVLADPSVEREAERDRSAAMSAASRPMPGSPNGQLTASQRSQMVDMAGRDQAAATARYQADTSAATQRETAAMREAGESARGFQREAGANTRAQAANEIQQAELGMKREAQGFQTREAERRESLVTEYEAAKTPEERAQIAQQIRDLSGREPAKPDNGLAVARTNLIGELGKQYAQVQPIGDDKKSIPFETWAAPMLRAAGMGATDPRQQEGVMLKGKDGKSYQVKNGVPVLVEAAARPAPAVGEVVAGHRFRGGNPNDRASWEAVR